MKKILLLCAAILFIVVINSSAQCTPPTTSAITGNVNVCYNSTGVVYSVVNTSGSTYAWTVTRGLPHTSNSNSVTVDWSTAGPGNVSVVETTFGGCVGSPVNLPVTVYG